MYFVVLTCLEVEVKEIVLERFTEMTTNYSTFPSRTNAWTQMANSFASTGLAIYQASELPCKDIAHILCVYWAPDKATLAQLNHALSVVVKPPTDLDGRAILHALAVLNAGKLLLQRAREAKASVQCLEDITTESTNVSVADNDAGNKPDIDAVIEKVVPWHSLLLTGQALATAYKKLHHTIFVLADPSIVLFACHTPAPANTPFLIYPSQFPPGLPISLRAIAQVYVLHHLISFLWWP